MRDEGDPHITSLEEQAYPPAGSQPAFLPHALAIARKAEEAKASSGKLCHTVFLCYQVTFTGQSSKTKTLENIELLDSESTELSEKETQQLLNVTYAGLILPSDNVKDNFPPVVWDDQPISSTPRSQS